VHATKWSIQLRNAASWTPSKFVKGPRGWQASRDTAAVSVYSRLSADRVAAFYARILPLHVKGHLLDLGCGTVPLYGAYRDLAAEVTCVDWGRSPHEVSHIDVEHDLTKPLPFEDERFDTIILSDVLEHLPEPQALWSEMARVLAPGGKIILNVPFLYWLHETPFDFHRYTEFALRRFAERCGLEVLELQPIGGAPEVVADIIAKSVIHYRQGRRLAEWVQRLCGAFVRRGLGARMSARTAARMPLGYGMVAQRPAPGALET